MKLCEITQRTEVRRGQRFFHINEPDTHYMLAQVNPCDMCLINVDNGNRYTDAIAVSTPIGSVRRERLDVLFEGDGWRHLDGRPVKSSSVKIQVGTRFKITETIYMIVRDDLTRQVRLINMTNFAVLNKIIKVNDVNNITVDECYELNLCHNAEVLV